MSETITNLQTKIDTHGNAVDEITEDVCGQCTEIQELKNNVDNLLRVEASGK